MGARNSGNTWLGFGWSGFGGRMKHFLSSSHYNINTTLAWDLLYWTFTSSIWKTNHYTRITILPMCNQWNSEHFPCHRPGNDIYVEWTDSRAIQIPIFFAGYYAKKKTIFLLGQVGQYCQLILDWGLWWWWWWSEALLLVVQEKLAGCRRPPLILIPTPPLSLPRVLFYILQEKRPHLFFSCLVKYKRNVLWYCES